MTAPGIGVVIVTYNSSDVILDCVESLLATGYPGLRILICDNASHDGTRDLICDWASGIHAHAPKTVAPVTWYPIDRERISFQLREPDSAPGDVVENSTCVTLICSRVNRGFAGAANIGLEFLKRDPGLGLFWILNPDCIVPQGVPRAFVETALADPVIGMIGSRVLFASPPHAIQSDGGGRVNPLTGNARSTNELASPDETLRPDPEIFDYIIGSNMVVTRAFLEDVGPMAEDYFLFYEEVDWAARRSSFKFGYATEGIVYHHGGTATGSWTPDRRPSELTYFFMFRNRMKFVRRFHRLAWPLAYAHSMLRVFGLYFVRRWPREALAAYRGLHGLAPPPSVKARIDPTAHQLAFGQE